MKNYSNIFRTMAALLLTGAVFSACTPDEEVLVKRTYSMTIDATQGYNDATKGVGADGGFTWVAGETISVSNRSRTNDITSSITVTEDIHEGKAKLSGTINGTIGVGDILRLERGREDFNAQRGDLLTIRDKAHCDVEVGSISDNNINIIGSTHTFVNEQAIVKFTFKNSSNQDLNISSLTITGAGERTISINMASANSTAYVALPGGVTFTGITATAIEDANEVNYSCTINNGDGATLTNGHIYNIMVGMTQAK